MRIILEKDEIKSSHRIFKYRYLSTHPWRAISWYSLSYTPFHNITCICNIYGTQISFIKFGHGERLLMLKGRIDNRVHVPLIVPYFTWFWIKPNKNALQSNSRVFVLNIYFFLYLKLFKENPRILNEIQILYLICCYLNLMALLI